MSNIAVGQHPADGSIWTFVKRDSFNEISALHFTEIANDLVLDWIKTDYISNVADGDNGPEIEFTWLVAIADPTRNAIMLAYQSYRSQFVFIDPLYATEQREGGTRAIGEGIPAVPHDDLDALPRPTWQSEKDKYVYETWVKNAKARLTPR